MDAVKGKIMPYIFAIYQLRKILPKKSLKMIYDAYIHSYLLYLNPIWAMNYTTIISWKFQNFTSYCQGTADNINLQSHALQNQT